MYVYNNYRSFWITWESGYFRVGSGEKIDSNVLIQYDFADMRQLSYVGVTTSQESYGTWVFEETSGTYF